MMDRGAYMFKDSIDQTTCVFLFCQMTDDEIKKYLPEGDTSTEGDYYIAMYKDNNNYLGRTVYSGITNLMKDEEMVDLNNLHFKDLPEQFSEMKEEEFANYLKFAELQVNNFPVRIA